jgi:autotransporter passenger strand-loop-strand repeat protein
VSSGGTDIAARIDAAGFQDMFGLASGATISGGEQLVEAGGTAISATIDVDSNGNSGFQDVFGVASVATISGGAQRVESGGAAISTTVGVDSRGDVGEQDVYGLASGTTISGGTQLVEAFGTAIGTTVGVDSSGHIGLQDVYGLASGTTISGGTQLVEAGGTAIDVAIRGGGAGINGGTLVLASGAVASGRIAFTVGGGMLEILGTAMPSATISGFSLVDTIDLASVASSANGSAVLKTGNVLDVVEGGSTYVLHLDPSQNLSSTKFVVTSDGSSGTDVTLVDLVSVTAGKPRPLMPDKPTITCWS